MLKKTEITIWREDIHTFGNLVPRDVASRAAKERCDAGFGIENNDTKEGVYLDFSTEIMKKGKESATEQNIHNPSSAQIYSLGKSLG